LRTLPPRLSPQRGPAPGNEHRLDPQLRAHASLDELAPSRAITLAGGVAIYLVGDALFRATLHIGRGRRRLACVVAVAATIPLGTAVAATAQIAAIVALLAACFALDAER
jgi:hypothetical protein